MKNNQLTIVARILAIKEKRNLVKAELLKLIDITRAEAGCINYVLHQDDKNPNLFLMYENWESCELLKDHMNSKHLRAFMKAANGSLEEFTVNEMTVIS